MICPIDDASLQRSIKIKLRNKKVQSDKSPVEKVPDFRAGSILPIDRSLSKKTAQKAINIDIFNVSV